MNKYNISIDDLKVLKEHLPGNLSDDECIDYYLNNKTDFSDLNITVDKRENSISYLDDVNTANVFTALDTDNVYGSIMFKDIEIARVLKESVAVLEPKLMPMYLRGFKYLSFDNIRDWLSSRVIPIDRCNAKKVLNLLGMPQQNNFHVALLCKALSLTDSYWYRRDNDTTTWEDNNLYKNKFSEVISEVAFIGSSYPSIQGPYKTPELTGQGSYAKCWVREDDSIYLYKASTDTGVESESEYIVSKLLDIMGIEHVNYEFLIYKKKRSCRCKIMTNENRAIVPFTEFNSFFIRSGESSINYIEKHWFTDYYNMLLVDGIIHNIDRHGYNWGVLMNESGAIPGLHPLFDHNCGIWIGEKEEYSHLIQNKTLLEVGKYAYKKLNKPYSVTRLLNWLESKEAKKLFNGMFTDKDLRRQFLISRINYILE